MSTRWTDHDDAAVLEIAWLTGEALAMTTAHTPAGSARRQDYANRKLDLVAHLDAMRSRLPPK